MLRRLDALGDTIVEVMIVLAILGLAMGIAYATANRSLLNARQAQENSQAAEYVQSQIEGLRYLAASTDPNKNIFNPPGAPTGIYCIHDPLNPTPLAISPPDACSFGSVPYTILIYNCDKVTTAPQCDSADIAANSDSFVVQATWNDVSGQGTDTATMVYRAHAQ